MESSDQYQNRIVAYIDILGFKETIKKTEGATGDKNLLLNLINVIDILKDEVERAISKGEFPPGTTASMFSDCIVVSIPTRESRGAYCLFMILKKLQVQLIRHEILLRGSIVMGELIHREGLIIGPGLISAYQMESKAIYPRIIVDRSVMGLFVRKKGKKQPIPDNLDANRPFLKVKDFAAVSTGGDFDGCTYIDYFNNVDSFVTMGRDKYYQDLEKFINPYLSHPNVELRMKYSWIREKLKVARKKQTKVITTNNLVAIK